MVSKDVYNSLGSKADSRLNRLAVWGPLYHSFKGPS